MKKNKRERKHKAFNLDKFAGRLKATGMEESKMTSAESINSIEDAVTGTHSYHKVHWDSYKFLKLNEAAIFGAILNIRGMEKQAGRNGQVTKDALSYFKSIKGKATKELAKFIEKYPSLAFGWFKLSEKRLMRSMHISRDVESRAIETLRDKGLLLSIVCGMPRERWVRINYQRYLTLLEQALESDEQGE